jgi:hypothetical protein
MHDFVSTSASHLFPVIKCVHFEARSANGHCLGIDVTLSAARELTHSALMGCETHFYLLIPNLQTARYASPTSHLAPYFLPKMQKLPAG